MLPPLVILYNLFFPQISHWCWNVLLLGGARFLFKETVWRFGTANQIKSNLHARGQPIWAQVIVGNLPHMYNTVQTSRATSDSQCRSFSMSAEMNEIPCFGTASDPIQGSLRFWYRVCPLQNGYLILTLWLHQLLVLQVAIPKSTNKTFASWTSHFANSRAIVGPPGGLKWSVLNELVSNCGPGRCLEQHWKLASYVANLFKQLHVLR